MNEVIFSKKAHILEALVRVCAELRGQVVDVGYSLPTLPKNELKMMLLTIAVESSFVHRTQIGGGPAVGLCGMEPETALDTFRWLEGKPVAWKRLTYIWMGLGTVPHFTPSYKEIIEHLTKNDLFSLALGRLHYRMFEEPFPDSLSNQAFYWKKYWNTEAGAGTVTRAMEQWEASRCDKLMKRALKLCHCVPSRPLPV